MQRRLKQLQAVILALFFANVISQRAIAGEPIQGFATLDWTVAETLIALGEEPQAVGDVKSYQQWVKEPKLPDYMMDLGIRLQPNPEQLLILSRSLHAYPLIFINSSFYAQTTPLLSKFAKKVEIVDFYQAGDAWQNLLKATEKIAQLIHKPQAYIDLMNAYLQKIAEIRPLVAMQTNRPIALVQFIDARHLRIYAENSPFGAVLKQLGFHNAWQGGANQWGFETIEITQLMKLPENSRFVVIKPYPSNVKSALQYNSIWQRLPMAQDPLVLPAVWTFGGVPSAERFAEILAQGLTQGGDAW